jgi:pimeloyl-ACP methyl ester carboxylesterase
MRIAISVLFASVLVCQQAFAQPAPFPAGFKTQDIAANGVSIHVRVGGKGPAVVMIHGFGDTGDMWSPLAALLARDHTVIVPDLRGMGLSSHLDGGYDEKSQGKDIAQVLDALKVEKADLVTHDIGNMVGYAFAAQHPDRVTRWVAMDAPLPGVGHWTRSSVALRSGISTFADRMSSASSPVASGSISTASGTNFPRILKRSTKRPASTMRLSMPGLTPCTTPSSNLPRLFKMPSTTRFSSQKEN